jgi:hypothetical protein
LIDNTQNSKWPACIAILGMTSIVAIPSDDPALVLACGSTVALVVGLLWRAGEPPVLLMAAGLQLAQVVVTPLYASMTGEPLSAFSMGFGDITAATWFALAAILSLAVGMWLAQSGARSSAALMRLQGLTWSPRAAFIFFLITLLLSASFVQLADIDDGLRQPALAAARIEWAGVFVLTYVCSVQRRGFVYVLLVACLELVKGFTGVFADFKEIFIVLLVGVVAATPRLKLRTALAGLVLASITLTLGVFWSAIKMDYRNFVSLGTGEQVALVPVEDRFAYLMDRVSGADGETMRYGLDRLIRRWGYVDLLAATMRNVPARVPFENGGLIGASVMHILQPRVLFPDKASPPSDTEITVRYSGIPFDAGGNAANTSISLGYVAELYVDFGFAGALVATFILGLVFGGSVRFVMSSTRLPAILIAGLAVVLMMSAASFEQALIKMTGGFTTTFVMILLIARYLIPYVLRISGQRQALRSVPDLRPS